MTEPVGPEKDEPVLDLDDLVARSDDLDTREQAAGGPAAMISHLSVGLKRQQRVTRWLTVSLILDIVLTVVLTVGLSLVNSNRNNVHASCVAGNEFRREDRALWDFFLANHPVLPGSTPAQRAAFDKASAAMKTRLDETFAPRVCP